MVMNMVVMFIDILLLLLILKLCKFMPCLSNFDLAYWIEKGYVWNKSDLAKLIVCINPHGKYADKEMDYWHYFINALNAPDSDIDFYIAGFIYCTLQESGFISAIPDSIQHSGQFIDGTRNLPERMEAFEHYISNETTSKLMSKALLEETDTIRSILADVGITTYKRIYGGEK